MYKSPIEVIYEDLQYQIEEGIYKAVRKVNINVDREELIKALAYDRGQYDKGYEDAKAEQKHGHWIWNDNCCNYSCSVCQSWIPEEQHYYARYCLYCGAKMDEGIPKSYPRPEAHYD